MTYSERNRDHPSMLMAMPADRIALQLTESFGLVGASY
jgi:hypothetical protein